MRSREKSLSPWRIDGGDDFVLVFVIAGVGVVNGGIDFDGDGMNGDEDLF